MVPRSPATTRDKASARIIRFPDEKRRPALVRAHLQEAARWIAAGLHGTVSLEEASTEAFLALNDAQREVLRGQLDREAV